MNVPRTVVSVVCLVIASVPAFAQPRVQWMNRYERVLVIVPMIGSGTAVDPIRPKHLPVLSAEASLSSTPFLGFSVQVSDDGKYALVELVAHDKSAFQDILGDASIKAFLKGRDGRDVAEAEFKKYKKNFSIANFGVRIP